VPNWSHSKKQVRKALDEIDPEDFKVTPTEAHGHSWGYIDCLNKACKGRFYVWSTPEDEDSHARKIRRFIQRHVHGES
jgi:hypothetical protein